MARGFAFLVSVIVFWHASALALSRLAIEAPLV
jgi:hypothetical protein